MALIHKKWTVILLCGNRLSLHFSCRNLKAALDRVNALCEYHGLDAVNDTHINDDSLTITVDAVRCFKR